MQNKNIQKQTEFGEGPEGAGNPAPEGPEIRAPEGPEIRAPEEPEIRRGAGNPGPGGAGNGAYPVFVPFPILFHFNFFCFSRY